MQKPTKKAAQAILIIQDEMRAGYGALVRAAARLRVTKQRVYQYTKKYPQYFTEELVHKDPEYLVCTVCEHEFPPHMRAERRNGPVCRDCAENMVYCCPRCNARFIKLPHQTTYCPSCRGKLVYNRHKAIYKEGGPKAVRLRKARAKSVRTWYAKQMARGGAAAERLREKGRARHRKSKPRPAQAVGAY